MSKAKSHIPEGFQSIVPYFHVKGAERFIDFVSKAFGAEQSSRLLAPDGKIRHAAVRIGNAMLEVSEATEAWGPVPITIHVYLPDTDAAYKDALEAGATSLYEPADMHYGERSAGVSDPFGNKWYIATHMEDISEAEMESRARELSVKQQQQQMQQ